MLKTSTARAVASAVAHVLVVSFIDRYIYISIYSVRHTPRPVLPRSERKVPDHVYAAFKKQADAGVEKFLGQVSSVKCCISAFRLWVQHYSGVFKTLGAAECDSKASNC